MLLVVFPLWVLECVLLTNTVSESNYLRLSEYLMEKDVGTAQKILANMKKSTHTPGMSSLYSMTCIDKGMDITRGYSLSKFVPKYKVLLWPQTHDGKVFDTLVGSPKDRCCVIDTADQCKIGGLEFNVMNKNLRHAWLADPLHRINNDLEDSLRDAGMWRPWLSVPSSIARIVCV